jgi:hypothetical protein
MRGVIKVNEVQAFKHCVDDEWRAADGNGLFDVNRPYDRRRRPCLVPIDFSRAQSLFLRAGREPQ